MRDFLFHKFSFYMKYLLLLLLLSTPILGISQSKTSVTDSSLTFVNNNELPHFEVLFNHRLFDLHKYIQEKDSSFSNIEFDFQLLIGPGPKARLDLKYVKANGKQLIFHEDENYYTMCAFMLYECEIRLMETPEETVSFMFPIKFDL